MAKKRTKSKSSPAVEAPAEATADSTAVAVAEPHFAEPSPSPDPSQFDDQHKDAQYYKFVKKNLLQAIPPPTRPGNLVLSLAEALGSKGADSVASIQKNKQIVFHCVGDTGPTSGPKTIELVADKMVEDFTEDDPADVPAFLYHLGDVVYNFGEDEYYYDQFYEPFREYRAPIFAIPGNHDGVTYTGDPAASLAAFRRNFCAPAFQKLPESGTLWRTAMIQPAVYFTMDAPFVRIIGLYSNVLEDPGVISSEGSRSSPVSDVQLDFLAAQLTAVKKDKFDGALIVAMHHPPYTGGSEHGGSPRMLQDLDKAFSDAGVYPHAVLSGHAHNYQRYTRLAQGRQTPYIVAGCGGHNISPIRSGKSNLPLRTPAQVSDEVTIDSYFAQYGYLRIVVNDSLLSIEYHQAVAGAESKSPVDTVAVDLAKHVLTTARP
jgi:hypothetical protein